MFGVRFAVSVLVTGQEGMTWGFAKVPWESRFRLARKLVASVSVLRKKVILCCCGFEMIIPIPKVGSSRLFRSFKVGMF